MYFSFARIVLNVKAPLLLMQMNKKKMFNHSNNIQISNACFICQNLVVSLPNRLSLTLMLEVNFGSPCFWELKEDL